MAFRLLQHRAAGSTDASRLEPGTWEDVPASGQFLLDVEFLTRCAPTAGSVSCLYCKSPRYLDEIARLFPWIHFYTYEHVFPVPEYDPLEPAILYAVPITVQVQDNKTTAAQELNKDMARTIGERSAREREGLLLICHGVDPIRQLALQANPQSIPEGEAPPDTACTAQLLMRPRFALLDICGAIAASYLAGEIVLPLHLPTSKLFACLVVTPSAKGCEYDQELYKGEMGERQRERARPNPPS